MSAKKVKRWMLGLFVFEGMLYAAVLLLRNAALGEAALGLKLLFALFVWLVNLPGMILAYLLGLGCKGDLGQYPDPHPVITDMVVFGFSLMIYAACLWLLTLSAERNDNQDQSGQPKD